jgi:hypothetical protein
VHLAAAHPLQAFREPDPKAAVAAWKERGYSKIFPDIRKSKHFIGWKDSIVIQKPPKIANKRDLSFFLAFLFLFCLVFLTHLRETPAMQVRSSGGRINQPFHGPKPNTNRSIFIVTRNAEPLLQKDGVRNPITSESDPSLG